MGHCFRNGFERMCHFWFAFRERKKILQVDRNGYYGGDGASLNLTNLFEKFGAGDAPTNMGENRDYNVDLVPKFIMAWKSYQDAVTYKGNSLFRLQEYFRFVRV